jgi:excisionase family DNA binding protein
MQETAIAYNLKSAARATGISARTLRRRIAEGQLRARRVGGLLIIEVKELERFIERAPDARAVETSAA